MRLLNKHLVGRLISEQIEILHQLINCLTSLSALHDHQSLFILKDLGCSLFKHLPSFMSLGLLSDSHSCSRHSESGGRLHFDSIIF